MNRSKVDANTIGFRIRICRDEYGLTQAQLGKKLGVTGSAVSQWENNKFNQRMPNFQALCKIFAVNMAWLLEGIGPRRGIFNDGVAADSARIGTGPPPGFHGNENRTPVKRSRVQKAKSKKPGPMKPRPTGDRPKPFK